MFLITIFSTIAFVSFTFYVLSSVYKLSSVGSFKNAVLRWYRKSNEKVFSRIRKLLKITSLFVLIGVYSFGCYNLSNHIAFSRFVSGYYEWRDSNGQVYLYVEANDHYSLGYLTGNALANKIFEMKVLLILNSLMTGKNYFDALNLGKQYLPYIPYEYQQELLGLSEGATAGSGFFLTFEDILFQNLFLEILYGQKFMDVGGGCTAFGTINSDNTTIIGQNIDLYQIMGSVSSFVLHKLTNEPLVFSFQFGAGMIPCVKSENNITVALNMVELFHKAPICTPLFVMIREALASTTNVRNFYGVLNSTNQSPYGINYIIADSHEILAAQHSGTNQTWKIPLNVTHSNTFLDPFWQAELKDSSYSKARQEYAEMLLSEAWEDSMLTLSELHHILGDAPIICRDEGGLLNAETIAFMTTSTFGIGNTNGNIGEIPI